MLKLLYYVNSGSILFYVQIFVLTKLLFNTSLEGDFLAKMPKFDHPKLQSKYILYILNLYTRKFGVLDRHAPMTQ